MLARCHSKRAKDVFHGEESPQALKLPQKLHKKAWRLLDQLDAAIRLETLSVPPCNQLKKLTGNYAEFWRIKINKQWAIIFKWEEPDAYDVDIIDYH